MNDALKMFWKRFVDWVEGNGPCPEDEVMPSEPPDPSFGKTVPVRSFRHYERGLRERYNEWVEYHGLRLFSMFYSTMSVLVCVVLVGLLLATVSELPRFGNPGNPGNNIVAQRYVECGLEETGAINIVAGMILDYRAFDTFGESAVLFTAAIGVLSLLSAGGGKTAAEPAIKRRHERHEDDSILRGVAALAIPVILLLGTAIVVNGHLSPGGGFSGGAVLSTALILCANAYGFERVRCFFSARTFSLSLCSSLLVYALAKGYSFFTGANHLESGIPTGTPGAILSGGLILPLNVCVGLIVAGTLYGFYALFSEGEI